MTGLKIQYSSEITVLEPQGIWCLQTFSECRQLLQKNIKEKAQFFSNKVVLDLAQIQRLDTGGSKLLIKLIQNILNTETLSDQNLELKNFSTEQQRLFEIVYNRLEKYKLDPQKKILKKGRALKYFSKLGILVLAYLNQLFGFLGVVSLAFFELIRKPRLFRAKEVFSQIEEACIKSIPVVMLVTFLIGVVIAYLMAMQLEKYGGHIFVVNAVAIAMCREMSPVIVALVMAGRSGSAYTAQIGAMKLNEEVDAITTLGLSVQQVLVLPRIIALIVSMPLLVFIGDLVGIFGGLMVADSYLGISHTTFIERLQTVLLPRHFIVGMVKAPVFAAVIAIIGCRRGLNTEMNARSVGMSTTATVVESIVLVIILNAIFAVIFAKIGV